MVELLMWVMGKLYGLHMIEGNIFKGLFLLREILQHA
jgi:hypothetical protein